MNTPKATTSAWEEEFDAYVRTLMQRNNDMLVRSAASGFKILCERLIADARKEGREDLTKQIKRLVFITNGIGCEEAEKVVLIVDKLNDVEEEFRESQARINKDTK